jgi:hypothetical protein
MVNGAGAVAGSVSSFLFKSRWCPGAREKRERERELGAD